MLHGLILVSYLAFFRRYIDVLSLKFLRCSNNAYVWANITMYNKLMSDFAPLVRAVSQVHVRFDEQMQLPASPLHAYS